VKVGIVVPQGWTGEYDEWDPERAWQRTVAVAQQAERLGFESIWLFDHFHTIPRPTDEITFESFTSLSALAMVTSRVRIGHLVICTGYRNPALTAKMISTMDVISGGRMELGIGAGWKRDEWIGYGYGFPEDRERLAILREHLEVITRMLGPGHATFDGERAHVRDAINVPKGIQQPRVPIMVGGNGPKVTWRLAAKYADELNLDGMTPRDVVAAMPVIQSRSEEIGRDPASLSVSNNMWTEHSRIAGQARVDMVAGFREAGLRRIQSLVRASADSDEALESFAADCRAAGAELG
jgi:F420-dependent oxidoreductase-like protein